MEGLLHGQKMVEIEALFEKAYRLSGNVLFFPVRHHSPACSFHLHKTIEAYGPDIILIEGPADTQSLLETLNHEDSEAPFCIYYSYTDKKGHLGDAGGKYMCYYPFLDYSPELVALREAQKRSIPAVFMDLPYPETLFHKSQSKGAEAPKESYNDDYLLQRGKFLEALCAKEGCRNFSELWEKLYEIDGLTQDTATFVKNMLAFCHLSRVDYTEEMLAEDGCSAREAYMAAGIQNAMKTHKKVLVVTGGFHTSGLIAQLETEQSLGKRTTNPQDAGAYAMAYSFEESDQLNGYASGMPYPAFYQKVWEAVRDTEEKPYTKALLHFIVRCGNRLRKNDMALSVADEIEAYSLIQGLAALRDKGEAGVYELHDAVRTAFVKGELSPYDKGPLEVLGKLLTGRKIGKLCSGAEVPPLVLDFRDKVKKLRLKANTTAEQEVVLDIYKNPRHREISRFLHEMSFMGTDFCKRIKGPDFVNKKNTNLLRETWTYRWNTRVESQLIELSVYGGSLEEAARELLKKSLKETGEHAGAVSLLMIDAYMMGLEESLGEIAQGVSEAICKDGVFYSTGDCTCNLFFLCNANSLLSTAENALMEGLVVEAYNKTAMLLCGIHQTPEAEENHIINKMKELYVLLPGNPYGLEESLFTEALQSLTQGHDCNSAVEGAAMGLLLGLNQTTREAVLHKAEGYLYGTGEKFLKSVSFLKGLFTTAREIVLDQDAFLKGIDHVLKNMEEDDFMKIMPDLRLAFSFFAPNEIDDIGQVVSGLYNTTKDQVVAVQAVEPDVLKLGMELDTAGFEMLKKWGIVHEQH